MRHSLRLFFVVTMITPCLVYTAEKAVEKKQKKGTIRKNACFIMFWSKKYENVPEAKMLPAVYGYFEAIHTLDGEVWKLIHTYQDKGLLVGAHDDRRKEHMVEQTEQGILLHMPLGYPAWLDTPLGPYFMVRDKNVEKNRGQWQNLNQALLSKLDAEPYNEEKTMYSIRTVGGMRFPKVKKKDCAKQAVIDRDDLERAWNRLMEERNAKRK